MVVKNILPKRFFETTQSSQFTGCQLGLHPTIVIHLRVVNWGCIQYNQYIQYNQFHDFNVPQSFALVDIMWIELIQFAVKRIKIRTRPGLVDLRFL